jgi:hypothetical protein
MIMLPRQADGGLLMILREVFLRHAPPARLFWTRRQAHETTIHAVDAQAAALHRLPRPAEAMINDELAADGSTNNFAVSCLDANPHCVPKAFMSSRFGRPRSTSVGRWQSASSLRLAIKGPSGHRLRWSVARRSSCIWDFGIATNTSTPRGAQT